MIEIILVALSVLGFGAVLLFGAAFFVLAASPTAMVGHAGPSASPASAQLWESARVASGAPEKTSLVSGLVKSLRSARQAIKGSQRNATR